ncbi:hypothetical protein BLNAU_24086 [Blattamonas nauphoetae]|uniref:Uncharacterized protein n=1 Tax=Blattamonas nauphoetae TaxID=2049346 RepID=A0ABQ9WNG5_9EUKA|nr:hypothetical protein BLNAU_24086 [Blattamonas nauphoetae]
MRHSARLKVAKTTKSDRLAEAWIFSDDGSPNRAVPVMKEAVDTREHIDVTFDLPIHRFRRPSVTQETLNFNLLAPVEVTKGCVNYNWTEILSAYTVEDVSIIDMCFPVALNGSEEIGLIRKNPRAHGLSGNLNITMNCHRLSNMQAQEVGMVSYSVLWNHPAFCPRPVRQKSKFTDHSFK